MLRTVADTAPIVRPRPDLFHRARAVRRRRRLLGAAAPATALAAAAAVMATTLPAADPPVQGGPPGLSTGAGAPDAVPDSAAAVVLRLAANHVEATAPTSIGAGHFVYTRTRSKVTGGVDRHETWAEPQGMITVRIDIKRSNGTVEHYPNGSPKDGLLREAARNRATLRQQGPSELLPTPDWLASLPTDGATLLRHFRDRNPADPKRTQDQLVFIAIQDFLLYAGPIMPPGLRAGLYRALALMPGVSRVPGQVDLAGRRGIGIGHDDLTTRNEIILDPQTFSVIGQRVVRLGGGRVLQWSTVDYAIVDELGGTP
jgi:hypothetical protein